MKQARSIFRGKGLYLLPLSREGHLSFTRSLPKLNNNGALSKYIYLYKYTHTEILCFYSSKQMSEFFLFLTDQLLMSFLSGIGGISQLYNEGAIYLTWHYITLNQGSLNFKKNHTHTKPKTLKPRDLQRPIISSQNRLLKQLGWMTLRRYPFSRIALWATVTSSNFNTHSYTFEDWQKKKNLTPVCMFTHPRNRTEEKVSITAGIHSNPMAVCSRQVHPRLLLRQMTNANLFQNWT